MPAEKLTFGLIADCDPSSRDSHAVAADLDGTLLVSEAPSFPSSSSQWECRQQSSEGLSSFSSPLHPPSSTS
ncbi:hypothetical protein HPP92_020405 [Vanilla planifolia]|uniref:Uncharacterized protein n=1 Tax=Vanilla planifolia TaxID=51239 RepID=A0A835UID4_VANPL|nr:hypothetical protein HPP92_020793 [Vanilla planifolia]KAG0461929.1 hypothetical protein HPP92_020405 [Vanilla planifolia]